MLNDRQTTILSYLTEHKRAKTGELLSLIGGYSTMTLWRDLEALEQAGRIARVRGGAVIAGAAPPGLESSFDLRLKQGVTEKQEICRIVLGLLDPDRAYYLDAGSTLFTLVKQLPDNHYTIVTSAANIAAELAHRSMSTTTLVGGQISSVTLSCSGPQAEQMLSGLNIGVALMGASGYSPHSGFTSGSVAEASIKRLVMKKAPFTVMLMDHTKLSKSYPFTFAELGEVDVLVGDSQYPRPLLEEARRQGVQVFTPGDGLSPEKRKQIFEQLLKKTD